jgi:hypothetical protein
LVVDAATNAGENIVWTVEQLRYKEGQLLWTEITRLAAELLLYRVSYNWVAEMAQLAGFENETCNFHLLSG